MNQRSNLNPLTPFPLEPLKHECGVAMIRLLKPLKYYEEKYGTRSYALEKLYLLMEKQHNRGQEGAGIACVNMDAPAGTEYMFRERAEGKDAITKIFSTPPSPPRSGIDSSDTLSKEKGIARQDSFPTGGGWEEASLLMGHLRYSTTGRSGLQYVHPFLRRNNWRAKNLCLCGNFNMTNIDEIFHQLTEQGQSPRIKGDAYIMLELMGHRLDREVERLYDEAKAKGLQGKAITNFIDNNVEISNVLKTSMPDFDGGYVMCGMTGSGEMFAMRDPWGIRPAYYYRDDEIVVVASERPVIQTTFNLDTDDIAELQPGNALIVNRNGKISVENIFIDSPLCQRGSGGESPCSFERIYFSRGSDRDIYQERKRLGEQLIGPIVKAIDGDIENTVFSYIPNTAEVAYYGLVNGIRKSIPKQGDSEGLEVRTEKVVWKDIKLRTFITEGTQRNDLAAHVYDISYGSLRPYEDNLVIIDDSIVRGTTLKESIFKILDRLHPKKIVMVSSSPQIRYPDYYGIDMSHLEELCAFRAAIALIKERNMLPLLDDVYKKCRHLPPPGGSAPRETRGLEGSNGREFNHVRSIYEPFTVEEINRKIVEMLRPEGMETPIELVFQSIEGLHNALAPSLRERAGGEAYGDWYFTGHYPTPGGVRLVNKAFVDFYENFV